MRVRLVLRHPHLCYLHSPLARISQLGISWRLRGPLSLLRAGRLFAKEFYDTDLNARVFPWYNYPVYWH